MKFEIKKTKNGVLLRGWHDGQTEPVDIVFQELDSELAESESFASFLHEILAEFGPRHASDGFSKHTISIRVEPGDEYSGGDPDPNGNGHCDA